MQAASNLKQLCLQPVNKEIDNALISSPARLTTLRQRQTGMSLAGYEGSGGRSNLAEPNARRKTLFLVLQRTCRHFSAATAQLTRLSGLSATTNDAETEAGVWNMSPTRARDEG